MFPIGRKTYFRCGLQTWNISIVHVHNATKWQNTCDERRKMYMTCKCVAQQVNIVGGDGNKSFVLFVRSNRKLNGRTPSHNQSHPEPLNDQVNTIACFEVSRLSAGLPVFHHVTMEYIDNSADEITGNPDPLSMTCGIVVLSS